MSKPPPPAPTASAKGPCPTVIKIVGRPSTGSLPSTVAPTDLPRGRKKREMIDESKNVQTTPIRGWSGGAMGLGKLPVPGRPTILITVGQGPTALAGGAGGGLFGHFYSHLSFLLFLPLFGRRPDID